MALCSDDPEVLRDAWETAKTIATGMIATSIVFKAQMKLRKMEADTSLHAALGTPKGQKAIGELERAIFDATAVPYVDQALRIKTQRRLNLFQAEHDLQAALDIDDPDAVRVAISAPALGSGGMPGSDRRLMSRARQFVTSWSRNQAEIDKTTVLTRTGFRKARTTSLESSGSQRSVRGRGQDARQGMGHADTMSEVDSCAAPSSVSSKDLSVLGDLLPDSMPQSDDRRKSFELIPIETPLEASENVVSLRPFDARLTTKSGKRKLGSLVSQLPGQPMGAPS